MKHCRLALLPALVLLLALPLTADVRTMPVVDGPPSASIEGAITHVGIPIATPGPIVTLLGGLVSLDAEGASVRYADGTPGTTASLAAGQRIVAFLDPAASPLKATSIVIFQERADVTLTGTVEAVDVAAGTLKLLGLTVKVSDKTVFGGPWDGKGQSGLDDVKVGDLVLVAAKAQEGSLVASRVMKLSPTPMPTVRLHGVVASIGTESWNFTLADGSTATVKVDARTKFVGEPRVGDEVDVLARKESDGSLLAVLVQKSGPQVQAEPYTGVLKGLSATAATIGPKDTDGPDIHFVVNGETKLAGDPKVGDDVGVLAKRQADGSLLAVVIAKLVVVPPVAEVAFDGVLKSTSAASPAVASGGVWLVDETKVVLTRSTVVRGNPRVGDRVHVEGLKGPDGSVMARLIAKL